MTLSIVENYVDPAGFRRVRVQNDADGESMLFKFPAGMTVAEMKAQAQVAINAAVRSRQVVQAERNRITAITDAIGQYQQGQLTLNQKGALLDALVGEWRDK